ncbi:MAG TPA: peptidyl-prolyl cis-trans isomerase [Tepidisphaeraceae bacterium]|nr:peptidyl-prolyl cis-trans isomerase [Tepidisphaeraceae bacterium]
MLTTIAAAPLARAQEPERAAAPASSLQPPALSEASVAPAPPVPSPGAVLAQIGPVQVTGEQVLRPLLEGYGLNILLNVAQLQMAREGVARSNLTVTAADIAAERERTIENMFKDSNEKQLDKLRAAQDRRMNEEAERIRAELRKDNEQAFEQFLQNQHISRAEFDVVTETNAYLRKLAEPAVAGKITEENLQQAFGALYGETVRCRHIQVPNLQEIQEAKRRLAAGQPFGKVAQDMSRNPSTGAVGGQVPAFSLQTQGYPQNFKDAAFALKEGEVSDVVQAEGSYHLILLEKRIPPKVVKFDDVKQSIRKDLEERAVQATMKQLRNQLSDQAVQGMVINDPMLKQQWDRMLAKRQAEIKDKDEIRRQLQRERERATTQPAPTGSDLAPSR